MNFLLQKNIGLHFFQMQPYNKKVQYSSSNDFPRKSSSSSMNIIHNAYSSMSFSSYEEHNVSFWTLFPCSSKVHHPRKFQSLPIVKRLTFGPSFFSCSTCLPWGSFLRTTFHPNLQKSFTKNIYFTCIGNAKESSKNGSEVHWCESILISLHCCSCLFVINFEPIATHVIIQLQYIFNPLNIFQVYFDGRVLLSNWVTHCCESGNHSKVHGDQTYLHILHMVFICVHFLICCCFQCRREG